MFGMDCKTHQEIIGTPGLACPKLYTVSATPQTRATAALHRTRFKPPNTFEKY